MSRDPLLRMVRRLDVSWPRAGLAVLLGVGALGSAVGLAAVSAWLIARASQMPPVLTLSVAVVAVRAFGTSRGVFRYLERLASHDVALRGIVALRESLYRALSEGRVEAALPLHRGDLLARLGRDVDDVGDVVVRALLPGAVALVLGIGASALVGAFLPAAGVALALCLLAAGVLAPALTAWAARRTEARSAAARAAMSATALRILDEAPQLTVSGALDDELARLRDHDRELERAIDIGARPTAWASAIGSLALGAAALAAILFGVPATLAGALDPVNLAVVALTPLAAFEATSVLPAAAVQLLRSRQAAARIASLLDAAADERPTPTSTLETPRGHLVARGVTCGWPERGPVLRDLDLDVRPGRCVALVGPSGVGKTTTLLTLAGLVPSRAGRLTLDGVALGALARTETSRAIVMTAEDAHVFDTTVLENLRVARGDVTPEEARRALEQSGLGAWLAALPDGLDTILGPDAATVSGGERRRLLLARTLLSSAPLLVIDEPAEHLDPPTADRLIVDLLRAARAAERGVILATHRLGPLREADEVLVLGDDPAGGARVVARGTHQDLLATRASYRWSWQQERAAPTRPAEARAAGAHP